MNLTPLDRMALRLYDIAWQMALPFLKRNPRLAEGYCERIKGPLNLDKPVDLWIQAASAGESYLALSLLESLSTDSSLKILITTNTRQGFDILNAAVSSPGSRSSNSIFIAYFPFDSPGNMAKVVRRLRPHITILLETEIWPGLLSSLKDQNLPAIILNGRLTTKSLQHYLLYPRFFERIGPKCVLAISQADAGRFKRLFPSARVDVMHNIKFDRITFPEDHAPGHNPLVSLFGAMPDLVVLGSVREEEEACVEKIISELLSHLPHLCIALFPRHMHRLKSWQNILNKNDWSWALRSAAQTPVLPGTILLWDTFGELSTAYALAKTVFVGGSLAKLGGQNFLEPLAYGIRPVIGPHWDNFFWIGEDIFLQNLVLRCNDWHSVATTLINNVNAAADPKEIKRNAQAYIQSRQGGRMQACALIKNMLINGEKLA